MYSRIKRLAAVGTFLNLVLSINFVSPGIIGQSFTVSYCGPSSKKYSHIPLLTSTSIYSPVLVPSLLCFFFFFAMTYFLLLNLTFPFRTARRNMVKWRNIRIHHIAYAIHIHHLLQLQVSAISIVWAIHSPAVSTPTTNHIFRSTALLTMFLIPIVEVIDVGIKVGVIEVLW